MKTISLKIPESLEQQLQRLALESDVSKSEILRRALELFLTTDKVPDSASVTALAGSLVGCFRGPTDLSTNTDHFDEFGQ